MRRWGTGEDDEGWGYEPPITNFRLPISQGGKPAASWPTGTVAAHLNEASWQLEKLPGKIPDDHNDVADPHPPQSPSTRSNRDHI